MFKLKHEREIEAIAHYYLAGLDQLQTAGLSDVFNLSFASGELGANMTPRDIHSSLAKVSRPAFLKHPDLFFPLLQLSLAKGGAWEKSLLKQFNALEPALFKKLVLDESRKYCGAIPLVEDRLKESIVECFEKDDFEIQAYSRQLFEVKSLSLSELKPPYRFSKINHGYWEFLLNSYLQPSGQRDFRDLSVSPHPINWRDFGFHSALFSAFEGAHNSETHSLNMGVSLSAGDRPWDIELSRELSPVSRGAIIGLCGFMASLGLDGNLQLCDGAAPRGLLQNAEYRTYFDHHLNQFDALLLLTPPPLKGLQFPKFQGDVYHFNIPVGLVHETYRVLLPTLAGLLQGLKSSHKSICVVTQSAVFAPLAALMIEACFTGEEISFVDLGRVLDFSKPDFALSVPSLASIMASGNFDDLGEYMKYDAGNTKFDLIDFLA